MDKILYNGLSLCCYAGCIFMVTMLFVRYNDNQDSSQVTMKQFNVSPEGRYPSFTFCIRASKGKLFRAKILENDLGLNQSAYYELLAGYQDAKSLKLRNIKFEEVVTKIDDFMEAFEVKDSLYEKYIHWESKKHHTMPSYFRPSYQDPTTNCFTYDTIYSSNVTLTSFYVKFNITKLKNLFADSGFIYIHVHYPGQMIRHMLRYLTRIRRFSELKRKNFNNQVTVSFSGITLMRFRETANDACDPKLIDDDSEWQKRAIRKIGCIPPYWNNNTDDCQEDETICDSKKELVFAKKFWRKWNGKLAKKIFDNYTKPCNTFTHLSNSILWHDHRASDILKINIRIQDDFYEEILSTKAVSRSDLLANLGGLVGIFCGYSLLQAASYLITHLKKLDILNK